MLIDTCLIPFESKKHCFKTLNNNFQNCLYFHFRKFFQEFLVISSDSSQIVVEDKGKDVITKPKTKKSIRKVYMPEQVAREMEDFIHGIYGYSQMKDCFRFPNHIYTMRWIEALRLVA